MLEKGIIAIVEMGMWSRIIEKLLKTENVITELCA